MYDIAPDQVQRIHKLLHDKQLLQAIRLYQEATGVSLAEAKAAVQRIEATIPRHSATALPYESAIGRNLFEKEDRTNRGTIELFAVALIITLCGVGGFILILVFNP